jgi:hypothetical protein
VSKQALLWKQNLDKGTFTLYRKHSSGAKTNMRPSRHRPNLFIETSSHVDLKEPVDSGAFPEEVEYTSTYVFPLRTSFSPSRDLQLEY